MPYILRIIFMLYTFSYLHPPSKQPYNLHEYDTDAYNVYKG